MFGWGNMPGEPLPRFPGAQEPAAPPSTDQLIAAGWGYVSLSTASIQADNGAGLTAGIIGLTNKGKRRTPEQWGSLRAWAWGAARALDYLETLPAVDARRVGIEGVSRYGKAALVTMAFEPRFAVVLVGSSGEGGAKPHRRNFGEQVENLTGSGEYHWMAGNFLKYGAAEASFGSKNANDIPVDAHELIALCAPRPTFISYGVPEKGDANWLDQQGSFMATVAAGPVFRLLGARDLGVTEDYRVAKMPPGNTGLLDGELAWRQHDGGHEDRSNMSFFIAWANRLLHHTPPPVPADQPRMRADRNSHLAHQQLLAKAKSGGIDVYFLGDSITRRWGALDYPDFLAHWNRSFHGWNAGNFGWGADRTENILWRLENGELDGVLPKVIVILAGTNNVGTEPGDESKVRRRHPRPLGHRRRLPEEGARGDDHPDRHLPAQRQSRGDADHRPHQRQPRDDGRREVDPVSRRQRQARRSERHPVRGNDGRRAAPEPEGLRGLGRGPEARPHPAPGRSRRERPRSATHGRPERERTLQPLGHRWDLSRPTLSPREARERGTITRAAPAVLGAILLGTSGKHEVLRAGLPVQDQPDRRGAGILHEGVHQKPLPIGRHDVLRTD